MKTLIICRHAKADYPEDTADFDRPLKEKGILDAEKQGKLLAEHDFLPDLILSSPAKRAIQTARIVAEKIGYTAMIEENLSIYHEGMGNLVSIIKALPEEVNTVMIFGHNPTLSDSVRYLLNMYHPFDMPTSGMVCLENPYNSWDFTRPQAARLRWVLVPRLKRMRNED